MGQESDILLSGHEMMVTEMLKEVVTMESESNGVHEPEEEVCSSVWIIVFESKAEPACGGRVSIIIIT